MSKWKCENPNCKKPCYVEPQECCRPTGCLLSRNNTPNWREEDEPTTKCSQSVTESNQLPKLTAEVFDRPDCPEWAKYAAVDENGIAFYYAEEPCARKHIFGSEDSMKIIDGTFDAADWKNSLIERPEPEFSDWCKQDAWIFDCNEREYAQVKDITGEIEDVDLVYAGTADRVTKSREYIIDCCFQARVRPYNDAELKALVGKIVEKENRRGMIACCDEYINNWSVYLADDWYDADQLLQYGYKINGKPCGVFEFYENGEWQED